VIVWTVANQKGGVGKTTTSVTLGGLLAEQGNKVLLIDMDPHGSMTSYLGYDPDTVGKGSYELFMENGRITKEVALSVIHNTKVPGLDVVPASMALATLDRQLGNQDGMGLVITQALQMLQEDYQYAIIDCPAILGVLMINALAACNKVLIPVQTEHLAFKGLERMIQTLTMVARARRRQFKYLIIPTMFDKRTRASITAVKSMRDKYGKSVWASMVPLDTRFRDASRANLPISALAPDTKGVISYKALLAQLLRSTDISQEVLNDRPSANSA